MPWTIQKANIGGTVRVFETRPDTADLRDRLYRPSLKILKRSINNRKNVPKMLDQGSSGAGTGFALAAVLNYLSYNSLVPEGRDKKKFTGVSPWMIYGTAKKYDRWTGEEYSGTSSRGALKAWSRHGVCPEDQESCAWPDAEAILAPPGVYYRVEHSDLNTVHAALNEVGVIYASLAVHHGWDEADSGIVPFNPDFPIVGGHSIALVGYDQEGLLFQNSWGEAWGAGGFGKISYDDWLSNAADAWVCQVSVPVLRAPTSSAASLAPGQAGRSPAHQDIRGYFVNTGNNGNISFTGSYYHQSSEEVAEFMRLYFESRTKGWRRPRLMLFAHGGLNSENACAGRIGWMNPVLLANEIYPIHFMWETGITETSKQLLSDAMKHEQLMGSSDIFGDWIRDRLDRGIENATRRLGGIMWQKMKENARLAFREIPSTAKLVGTAPAHWGSGDEIPGGTVFLHGLVNYLNSFKGLELNLVGHSAGSIWFAYFIRQLASLRPRFAIRNLILYAPACRVDLFCDQVLGHISPKGLVRNLTLFNLDDKTELQDNVADIYHKSLLYLVSNSYEDERGTPLVGLNKFLTGPDITTGPVPAKKSTALKALRAFLHRNPHTLISSPSTDPSPSRRSDARSHGGFGSDKATLNSTIRIILGKDTPTELF